MEWKDLRGLVGKTAPLLGTLLGGPAGTAIGAMISSVIGSDNDPDEVHKALQADPSLLVQLRQAEMQHKSELQRMTVEAETAQLTQINETMRAELASGNWFKSSWRPLFGYVMALSYGAVMFALTYKMLVEPSGAATILQAVGDMTWIWGIGLAVLGVNVSKRSADKAAMFGQHEDTIMGALASRLKR